MAINIRALSCSEIGCNNFIVLLLQPNDHDHGTTAGEMLAASKDHIQVKHIDAYIYYILKINLFVIR